MEGQAPAYYPPAFPGAVLNPNSGELALNMKLICDDAAADSRRRNSNNGSHDQAWESFRFRVANEAQTISHLAALNVITTAQTGDTDNQQSVNPIRTGAGDNVAAGATPANRITDTTGAVSAGAVNASIAQAALGNVTAQLATLTTQVTTLAQTLSDSNAGIAALLAQLVANSQQPAKT